MISVPVFETPSFKKTNTEMSKKFSGFDRDVAAVSAACFGVEPTTPFSSLADPEASSVAELLKLIPGVTYTPRGGVILPDSTSELGEMCGKSISAQCTDKFCSLAHPLPLFLAGAVCSLMTKYCQPKAQPQPSPCLAGGKVSWRHLEKMQKLRALFLNNKIVQPFPKPFTTNDDFVRYCSQEWVQQLCCRSGARGYRYVEAADIYRSKTSVVPFHELAEYAVNKYNSEQKGNLQVKRVLKANWMNMFFYMTIEAWDSKTNTDHTLQTAIWIRGSGNFVVGYFKDVTDSSVSNVC